MANKVEVLEAMFVDMKDRIEAGDPTYKDATQAFFDEAKIANLEPYTDPDNALLAAFGNNTALPTTILYDSQSREVWRVIGGVEWDDAEMAKLLREAD